MWVGIVHYTLHPMIFEFTKSCDEDSARAAGTFTGHKIVVTPSWWTFLKNRVCGTYNHLVLIHSNRCFISALCHLHVSNNDGVADCTGTRKPCVWVFTPSAVIRAVFVHSCTQKIYSQELESLARRFGTPCYGKFIHYFYLQRGIEPRWRLSPSVDLLPRPHLEIDWLTCKNNSGDYAYI